jgi:hypothetical protein
MHNNYPAALFHAKRRCRTGDNKNKYLIYEENGDIKLAELQHKKFDEDLGVQELKGDISLLSDLDNSFKQLLPCKAFGVDMNRKPIIYEEILREVKLKIIEPKLINSPS